MGFLRTLQSVVNSEVMGEEIVKTVINIFNEHAKYNPGESRHSLLAMTYHSRLNARRVAASEDLKTMTSMSTAMMFADLPKGSDVKALALYILNEERPDIIAQYPKFGLEFERLMGPLSSNA